MKHNIENNLNNKTMTLQGQGQVFTVPNVSIVQLGVVTTGENLVDTQAENALISQQIIQILQSMGVVDIKTAQYSINKVYDYENGRQIDRGYLVRNILEIKTNNLEMVGNIIDSTVLSGANCKWYSNSVPQNITMALKKFTT